MKARSFLHFHKSICNSGFTLIELLVVIAIIAILAVVVVLTLNPAELLKQSRDANRLSDAQTITSALGIYNADQSGASSFNLGSSSVLYVAASDPLATSTAGDQCQGLGISALPSGWTYHCAASSTLRNTKGQGWLPVNFNTISSGNPLGGLPVDPNDQTSTWQYYTYATNGTQWQLYSHFESTKNVGDEAGTSGYDPASYKVGTNVNIAPFAGGMTGYWPFSEGSGGTTADLSGYGNTGTLNSVNWATGIVGNALSFSGSSGNVALATDTFGISPSSMTITAWLYASSTGAGGYGQIISNSTGVDCGIFAGVFEMGCTNNGFSIGGCMSAPNSASLGQWYFFAAIRNSLGQYTLYINGAQSGASMQTCGSLPVTSPPMTIGSRSDGVYTWGGLIDDLRVYTRQLTATEIGAIYNTKQ